MAFEGLLRALDGRQTNVRAMHIWQWEMTGSQGSTWNINPSASANQADNRQLASWLSQFVRSVVPGDYNGNGIVDAGDYIYWRNSTAPPANYFDGADGNGNRLIDAGDYSVWRAHFGESTGSGAGLATSVPEPLAPWIFLGAVLGGILSRRHLAD